MVWLMLSSGIQLPPDACGYWAHILSQCSLLCVLWVVFEDTRTHPFSLLCSAHRSVGLSLSSSILSHVHGRRERVQGILGPSGVTCPSLTNHSISESVRIRLAQEWVTWSTSESVRESKLKTMSWSWGECGSPRETMGRCWGKCRRCLPPTICLTHN